MYNYGMNQNNGNLYDSNNQYAGNVRNNQVYGTNGQITGQYTCGNTIRDGYHNVVGTISPTTPLTNFNMQTRNNYNF